LPQSGDIISLSNAGDVVLDVNFNILTQLTVEGSGTTLRINSGVTLTIDSIFLPNGEFDSVIFGNASNIINDGVIEGVNSVPRIRIDAGTPSASTFTNNNQINDLRFFIRSGMLINNGTITTGDFSALTGTLENNGLIDDSHLFLQFATVTNNVGGVINITASSLSTNNTIFDNHGTVTNLTSFKNESTFNNFGTFDNTNGTFTNNGTFITECDSVLLGTLTGNPPVVIPCDVTPPVITVPVDVIAQATSALGAVVVYTVTANDETDGPVTPSCSPVSSSQFELGGHTVNCSATDAAGNTANASFSITVIDTTPPVIVPNVTGTLGLAGWYVSDVSVSWTVTDPESAIVSMVGCQPDNVTTDTTGAIFTCTASSAGGVSSFSITIMRDVTPPVVVFGDPSPPANAAGWHNSIVSVSYSCDDSTSGSGDSDVLQTGQDGTGITVDATCVDTAGNSASATSGPFNIDGTPPTVSITSPIDGATFIQNEAIISAYSCADVLSDVSSCIGPVISGADVDTTVIGGQSFAVTGTDSADNSTSLTHGYMVISVSNAVANVMDLVASFNLQQGLDNSFDAKLSNLQAALDASNAGQRNNAINMIQAFLNEVDAQRGKKLTNEQADSLVAAANRILMILLQ